MGEGNFLSAAVPFETKKVFDGITSFYRFFSYIICSNNDVLEWILLWSFNFNIYLPGHWNLLYLCIFNVTLLENISHRFYRWCLHLVNYALCSLYEEGAENIYFESIANGFISSRSVVIVEMFPFAL